MIEPFDVIFKGGIFRLEFSSPLLIVLILSASDCLCSLSFGWSLYCLFGGWSRDFVHVCTKFYNIDRRFLGLSHLIWIRQPPVMIFYRIFRSFRSSVPPLEGDGVKWVTHLIQRKTSWETSHLTFHNYYNHHYFTQSSKKWVIHFAPNEPFHHTLPYEINIG